MGWVIIFFKFFFLKICQIIKSLPLGDKVISDFSPHPALLSKYSTLNRYYLDNQRKRSYNTHTWKRLFSSCCHSINGVGNIPLFPFPPRLPVWLFLFFSPLISILITLFRGPPTAKTEFKWTHLENPKKLWSQLPAGKSLAGTLTQEGRAMGEFPWTLQGRNRTYVIFIAGLFHPSYCCHYFKMFKDRRLRPYPAPMTAFGSLYVTLFLLPQDSLYRPEK